MHSISDAFESPEYFAFKELVSKSSVDNSLNIQNNMIVYGKNSKHIPNFRSFEYIENELNDLRTKLLLDYSDLYDQIILSEEPEIYKNKYNILIKNIQDIENTLDEIFAFLQSQNEMNIVKPIKDIENKLEDKRQRVIMLINTTQTDIHINKNTIKDLLKINKDIFNLHQELSDIMTSMKMNYVIWNDTNKKNNTKLISKRKHSSKLMSGGGVLTKEKQEEIKKLAKQVMLKKLF
jgi:hypothetical protein